MGVSFNRSYIATYQLFLLNFKMSWQNYVDTQMIEKKLKQAAIAGLDGSIWAKSDNFEITTDEVKKVVDNYDNQMAFASTGINVAGQKYFYLSGTDDVVRGKQGKGGVHIMKTGMAVLVGIYDEPMQGAEAATITENLGSYLKGCGY